MRIYENIFVFNAGGFRCIYGDIVRSVAGNYWWPVRLIYAGCRPYCFTVPVSFSLLSSSVLLLPQRLSLIPLFSGWIGWMDWMDWMDGWMEATRACECDAIENVGKVE